MKSTLLLTLLLTVSMAGCGGSNTNTSSASTPTTTATASAVTMAAPTTIGKIEDISNAQLQTLLDQGVTLVDIRLPEEWKQTGVVKGSQLLTLFDAKGGINPEFPNKINQIAPTNKPIAIICRTGNRTQVGAQMLSQAGYSQVYNVQRGITGWIKEGLPVVPQ
ncbi:MAG: rhodanese-like domain-containing protein [Thiofilum sp.]|uniref:rhodanese-like domain-containing protein n=1 Tax=Thiofilum sp. TaxID=2212733 RepID=UPI0025D75288|nr:rhodanese-like domain-containing protein [Thiofilum sp.]MBK8452668.1 rhodanese-like domain-containing protein [Thiofilum sp.]